ncbi:uncharacterized protein RMCFA_3904 [Mycolicibacterium fortuitum subsp. acetamidolyticum]|uniref:Uncharacterized protein n=1 Tax=Mycolicibacterium fortuitum subsp. acetamidolyticum TaxID=144550 RepID=A0A100WSP3_MYCFO|nr:hypothetical protein [Mycolicibacterium fortuitum]MCV7143472.1 hypothetical protein [Mycolicibacterium fortuitum]GAT03792.1 uncharacterized protein RMCFA_3904 [Mycolicibacterium fortuitum subsp. acetamidolyticum]
MGGDPFDPIRWGIDPVTAKAIERFGTPWAKIVLTGRFGEICPPPAVSDRVPGIAQMARVADPGRWFWETTPPDQVFRRLDPVSIPRANGWTTLDNNAFAQAWTDDLDATVDEFISLYGSAWPAAIANSKPESNPVSRFIKGLIQSGAVTCAPSSVRTPEKVAWYRLQNALKYGPFNVTVLRRTWEFPTVRTCDCCGAEHYYDLANHYLIRVFGRPGICAPCMRAACYGVSLYGEPHNGRANRSQIIGALRQFADLTKTIPSSRFRESVYTGAMSDADRGVVTALLVSLPESEKLLDITGCTSWLEVLQAAGIVGSDGWRPARGTICLANDGHQCRSLAEKAICDWFFLHGVDHVIEPAWPKHPQLNPSGRFRADWAIGDVYIEFAGMMSDSQYSDKMGRKIQLAQEAGITLVVLQPEDLPRLDSALNSFLSTSDS